MTQTYDEVPTIRARTSASVHVQGSDATPEIRRLGNYGAKGTPTHVLQYGSDLSIFLSEDQVFELIFALNNYRFGAA